MPTRTQTPLTAPQMAERYMREGKIPLSFNLKAFTAELAKLLAEQERRQRIGHNPIPIPLDLIAGAASRGVQVDPGTGKVIGFTAPDGIGV